MKSLLALGLSLLALTACGGSDDPADDAATGDPGSGATGSGGDSGATGSGGDSGSGGDGPMIPPVEDDFDPPPAPTTLSPDELAGVAASIDDALATVSGTDTVLVVGADTGQTIYEKNPDGLLKPASNTKLFTTATAFRAAGEEARFQAIAYAGDDPADGVISGDLTLVVEHDFTFSTFFYGSNAFPFQVIAGELKQKGLTQVTGAARISGEACFGGEQFGTYDAAGHRAAAASAFRTALVNAGIAVGGSAATSASFDPPAGATEMLRWRSLPLRAGAFTINVVSHNEFADTLAHHNGWVASQESTYAAGGAAAKQTLADLGVDTTGLALNDGSGLSHDNRVSARMLVGLLGAMLETPEGPAWRGTFAVAGVRGTLGSRMTGADTIGRFFGKTGSLTGVIALSGVLDNRHDGQRYLASMLMNDVGNTTAARAAHDSIVRAVARDHHQKGARPAAPLLASVKNDANGETALVGWSEVEGASGYLLWRSADGKVWDRAEARLTTKTSFRTKRVGGAQLFVKVTAVGEAGESDFSDTYGAGLGTSASKVVLVDGNDRWQAQPAPDNVAAQAHDFLAVVGAALDQPFDSCANEAVIAGDCALDGYQAAVWSLGNESTEDETFDASEQELVRAFVAAGKGLLVNGAEVAWDLGAEGSADDQAFLSEVLHATYVGDDSGTSMVRGLGPAAEAGIFSFFDPGREGVEFPDSIAPAAGGETVVEYVGGAADTAGVRAGDGHVVLLAFPLETVDELAQRKALLDLVLADL
jgi:D-alanyl-D-alanine carboxypeptidase